MSYHLGGLSIYIFSFEYNVTLGWRVTKCVDVLKRGSVMKLADEFVESVVKYQKIKPLFARMLAIKYVSVLHMGKWLFLLS